ncbi:MULTISPECIES: DUF6460 domain-containing protein [unclassified Devosia]|uniref:DUF6460 domain-containing protein n=1 Tax=unclassified Devosia TaxID=196773 RepID=UPI0013E3F8F8|nr:MULTISPECIES: DUF6460 domain-containing protein [unclassified Devosia]
MQTAYMVTRRHRSEVGGMIEDRDELVDHRSWLERFMGGRPGGVILRLILLSLVAGFFMSVFGVDATEIFRGAVELVRETLRDSAGVARTTLNYVLTGAALVIPIWLLLRLTGKRR